MPSIDFKHYRILRQLLGDFDIKHYRILRQLLGDFDMVLLFSPLRRRGLNPYGSDIFSDKIL